MEVQETGNVLRIQVQGYMDGITAGDNRPNVQYDNGECHYCVEIFRKQSNSESHEEKILENDPNTGLKLMVFR